MNKHTFLVFAFFATACLPGFAQELSIDEAIQRINKSARNMVEVGLRMTDDTGDYQFVGAEVLSVHNINDYSYGALMDSFERIVDARRRMAESANSPVWPEECTAILKQNPKLLAYAKEHPKTILGYSAVVDYIGTTKYKEKKQSSSTLYFDARGSVIIDSDNLRFIHQIQDYDSDFINSRSDIKDKLATYMLQDIALKLGLMNDPDFPFRDYWISDVVKSTMAGRIYEQQWCYRFTKENHDDKELDKGPFQAYYYQIQRGPLSIIKSIFVVDGTYEKNNEHIWLSYDNARVRDYHIAQNAISTFDPGNYKYIDYRILEGQLLETARVKSILQKSSNTPSYFEQIDENTFKMTVPFVDNYTFTFKRNLGDNNN